MHTLLQIRPRLAAQTERIVAVPLQLQPRQLLVLILLRPHSNPTITALDQTGNVLSKLTTAIQTHRLQASQLIGIVRLPLGLLVCLYILVRQLRLSLSNKPDYPSGDFFSIYP